MSTRAWWDAQHPPRHYAEALLAMAPDKERQRSFFETHVPEHLQAIVMDHVKTQMALGGSNEEG